MLARWTEDAKFIYVTSGPANWANFVSHNSQTVNNCTGVEATHWGWARGRGTREEDDEERARSVLRTLQGHLIKFNQHSKLLCSQLNPKNRTYYLFELRRTWMLRFVSFRFLGTSSPTTAQTNNFTRVSFLIYVSNSHTIDIYLHNDTYDSID